jgi:hypothetical protein
MKLRSVARKTLWSADVLHRTSVAQQPYEPWPLLGFFFLRRFSTKHFLQREVILTPNPQPGGLHRTLLSNLVEVTHDQYLR